MSQKIISSSCKCWDSVKKLQKCTCTRIFSAWVTSLLKIIWELCCHCHLGSALKIHAFGVGSCPIQQRAEPPHSLGGSLEMSEWCRFCKMCLSRDETQFNLKQPNVSGDPLSDLALHPPGSCRSPGLNLWILKIWQQSCYTEMKCELILLKLCCDQWPRCLLLFCRGRWRNNWPSYKTVRKDILRRCSSSSDS